MVSIKWCLKQKRGLELVEPNPNMSDSYIKMADESISVLNRIEKSKIWTATATYYVFYYSLYSLMLRVGVKCEIHACSLEFMKRFLNSFYNKTDLQMIQKSFDARIDLQYYADRDVDEKTIEQTKSYCKTFYITTKDALAKITEEQIQQIREKLTGCIKK